jgi:hypothetical protein
MTEIQRPRRTTWWRAVSRAAAVLRDLHHEQVYARSAWCAPTGLPLTGPGR